MTTNETLSAIKEKLGNAYWNHAFRGDDMLLVWYWSAFSKKGKGSGGEIIFYTRTDSWEADRYLGEKKTKGQGIKNLIKFLEKAL